MLRKFNKMKTYSYTQNSQPKAYKCQALDPLKYEFNIFSYCNGLRPACISYYDMIEIGEPITCTKVQRELTG